MICSKGELSGENNLKRIYVWLWDASLHLRLSLGVSDILGIRISNSGMRPQYKTPWEEGSYSAVFPPPRRCPLAPDLMMQLESIPSHTVGLLCTQEPSQATQGVRLALRLVHIVSVRGEVIRRPTWRPISRAHVIIWEGRIP